MRSTFIGAVLLAAACAPAPPSSGELLACRRPAQLPTLDIVKSRPAAGERVTARIERVWVNDPLLQPEGFSVALPSGWRFASGSFVRQAPMDSGPAPARLSAAASSGTGAIGWPTEQGEHPRAVTVDLTLGFDGTDPSVPRAETLERADLPVQLCDD